MLDCVNRVFFLQRSTGRGRTGNERMFGDSRAVRMFGGNHNDLMRNGSHSDFTIDVTGVGAMQIRDFLL